MSTAAIDTATDVEPASGPRLVSPRAAPTEEDLRPVGLPSRLGVDFPVPPGATVVDSTSIAPAGGAHTTGATIALEGNARETFHWYRIHLRAAGWTIEREDQRGQAHSLTARRGRRLLTLIVQVHPEYPGTRWTRILATMVEKPVT